MFSIGVFVTIEAYAGLITCWMHDVHFTRKGAKLNSTSRDTRPLFPNRTSGNHIPTNAPNEFSPSLLGQPITTSYFPVHRYAISFKISRRINQIIPILGKSNKITIKFLID